MYQMLIVDDEPNILKGMSRTLDWNKYGIGRIETAQSYEEAVVKAIEMKPDIGIFDVCIGETRGYDLINRLNEMNLKTQYIMMSGYEEFHYVRESLRCGAKDYLLKPVDNERLRKIIEKIIIEDLHGEIPNIKGDEKDIDPVLQVRYDTFSNLINKILLIVRSDYAQNLTLKSIADKFKMNGTYLGQIFLKGTHLKFSEYLMVYRLLMAREKILKTDEKISYIAYSVGYSNLNYFYSHFHDYFDLSPLEMRAKSREEI